MLTACQIVPEGILCCKLRREGQNFEMDILGIRDSLPPLPVDVTPRVSPFELENFFAGLLSSIPASTEEEWKELEEALNKDRLSNRQLFKE